MTEESKAQPRCGCGFCAYCSMPLSKRHEHDHFPTPEAVGGTETVPTCVNCHDLKDRLMSEQWPVAAQRQALIDLGVPPALIAEPTHKALDALGVEGWWNEATPLARLLYAKLKRRAYGQSEHPPGWAGTGRPRLVKGRLRDALKVCPRGHTVEGENGYDIPGLAHRRGCHTCTNRTRKGS